MDMKANTHGVSEPQHPDEHLDERTIFDRLNERTDRDEYYEAKLRLAFRTKDLEDESKRDDKARMSDPEISLNAARHGAPKFRALRHAYGVFQEREAFRDVVVEVLGGVLSLDAIKREEWMKNVLNIIQQEQRERVYHEYVLAHARPLLQTTQYLDAQIKLKRNCAELYRDFARHLIEEVPKILPTLEQEIDEERGVDDTAKEAVYLKHKRELESFALNFSYDLRSALSRGGERGVDKAKAFIETALKERTPSEPAAQAFVGQREGGLSGAVHSFADPTGNFLKRLELQVALGPKWRSAGI